MLTGLTPRLQYHHGLDAALLVFLHTEFRITLIATWNIDNTTEA